MEQGATEFRKESPRGMRFSLRSLLLCVLLIGSGFALWFHWGPWEPVFRFQMDPADRLPANYHVEFNSDADRFYAVNARGELVFWDAKTGDCIGRLEVGNCRITGPTGHERHLYLASKDAPEILVVDPNGLRIVRRLKFATGTLAEYGLRSSDERWLFGRNDAAGFAVWKIEDGTLLASGNYPTKTFVAGKFSRDSRRVYIKGDDQYQIWDLDQGRKLAVLTLPFVCSEGFRWYLKTDSAAPARVEWVGGEKPPVDLKIPAHVQIKSWWSVGDGAIAGTKLDGGHLVFNPETGELICELPAPDEPDPEKQQRRTAVGAFPDMTYLARIDEMGRIDVQEMPSGRSVRQLQEAGERPIQIGQAALDEPYLYSIDEASVVRIWDLKNGALVARMASRAYGPPMTVWKLENCWVVPCRERSLCEREMDFWTEDGSQILARVTWTDSGWIDEVVIKPDGLYKVDSREPEAPKLYRLRRPAIWYGFLWLPELYLTLALALGLAWSLWRDRRL